MIDNYFALKIFHMHLLRDNTVIFIGVFRDDNPKNATLHAIIDGQECPIDIKIADSQEVRRRNLPLDMNASQEVIGEIHLPDSWRNSQGITLEYEMDGRRHVAHRGTRREIAEFTNSLLGNLDYSRIEGEEVHLAGWVAAQDIVCHLTSQGKEIPYKMQRRFRRDARELFPELEDDAQLGFDISCPVGDYPQLQLTIQSGDKTMEVQVSMEEIRAGEERFVKQNIFQKGIRYYRNNGVKKTISKIASKLMKQSEEDDHYDVFLKNHQVTPEMLQAQREANFAYQPTISIVIPLYNTPKPFLQELIQSIMEQTYPRWQLCLADGSETNQLEQWVREFSQNDERVCYRLLGYNDGISKNTNGAIEMATGDFIAFSDHDDLLTIDALYWCVSALNEDDTIDCLYSDEDKIDMDGETLFMPHFKTDFNIDLLCSHNYITHLFVCRKTIVDQVGRLRSEYDGSQDHDMIFRCVEQSRRVYHIPRVLYHWRCHKNSTAMNPESKLYCYESGRKAVEAHFQRLGLPVTVENASNYGYYRTIYHWAERPLVSIIIPNMNHMEDLKKCISSIQEKSSYSHYEIIVVENNSTPGDAVFDYYDELKKQDHIMVVTYQGEFNYSKINNFGVEHAQGEYILLLNNDTELIAEDSIKEMLDICMRDDVGAVGARLYFADNTVQHAGVILGVGGIANHAFLGIDRGDVGYFFRSVCVQDFMAVTAACMMTKRSVFEEVGGLTEDFAVAYNDVDYCLKLGNLGKRIVYTPFSEWYHYESKSRGYEDTPAKKQRLEEESRLFMQRWSDVMKKEDPYYSPNLNHDRADYAYNLQG